MGKRVNKYVQKLLQVRKIILDSENLTEGGGAIIPKRPSHNRPRCWSCTAIHCVHVVRYMFAGEFGMFPSEDTSYLRGISSGFRVLPHSGR